MLARFCLRHRGTGKYLALSVPAFDVSVILVNFDSGELGARAADAVRRQHGVNVELIVVDNASSDGSLEAIVSAAAPEHTVRHTKNLGYAAAVNAGVALASAPAIVPLNCDAELGEGYLERALTVLREHPRVAVVGGAVSMPGGRLGGPQRLTISMRVAELPPVRGECVRVDASCPVWRREAVDAVAAAVRRSGPLDERFFVYGENVDLACSLSRLGWVSWFEPAMTATHQRSFSSAHRVADKRGFLRSNVISSRWINVVRHGAGWRLPAGLARCLAEDLAFVVLRVAAGDLRSAPDVARAWGMAWRGRRTDLQIRAALPRRAITAAG